MLNKKGSEKLFSGWWFLILVIVFLVFSYGILIFYSSELDVRGLEARVLSDRIYKCLNDYSKNSDLNKEENILILCDINTLLFQKSSDYYLKVNYNNMTFRYGDFSFEKDCEISMGRFKDERFGIKIKADRYPVCLESNLTILNKEGEIINLNILSASNQIGGSNE
jgi:hypothetical protein